MQASSMSTDAVKYSVAKVLGALPGEKRPKERTYFPILIKDCFKMSFLYEFSELRSEIWYNIEAQ